MREIFVSFERKMDLIIKNGLVLDGLGNPWFHADVGVDGKKIKKIGKISEKVENIIDAKGMIVAPGFIDIHNHSDVPLLVSGRAESMVHQGVTTMLTCQCGGSPFPLFGESLEHAKREYSNNYGLEIDWSTLSEYKEKLEHQGISINVALQIGHGTVRAAIMGYENKAPNMSELKEMKKLVSDAMEGGCFGMSTGLGYPPGMFAKTDEIIELCKVVAKYDGIYSTHTRGFGPLGFPQKIQEALEIGEKAGLPVQMSHIGSSTWGRENWGKARTLTLNLVDAARAKGIDFTADIYPYIAGSGNLNAVLPTWVHEGGLSKMLDRLARPEIREKIAQEIKGWDWSQLLMYHLRTRENKIYEGKTVQQVSEMKGLDPINFVCNILIEENGSCPIWDFFGLEDDIRTLMKHEAVMIGSDGSVLNLRVFSDRN